MHNECTEEILLVPFHLEDSWNFSRLLFKRNLTTLDSHCMQRESTPTDSYWRLQFSLETYLSETLIVAEIINTQKNQRMPNHHTQVWHPLFVPIFCFYFCCCCFFVNHKTLIAEKMANPHAHLVERLSRTRNNFLVTILMKTNPGAEQQFANWQTLSLGHTCHNRMHWRRGSCQGQFSFFGDHKYSANGNPLQPKMLPHAKRKTFPNFSWSRAVFHRKFWTTALIPNAQRRSLTQETPRACCRKGGLWCFAESSLVMPFLPRTVSPDLHELCCPSLAIHEHCSQMFSGMNPAGPLNHSMVERHWQIWLQFNHFQENFRDVHFHIYIYIYMSLSRGRISADFDEMCFDWWDDNRILHGGWGWMCTVWMGFRELFWRNELRPGDIYCFSPLPEHCARCQLWYKRTASDPAILLTITGWRWGEVFITDPTKREPERCKLKLELCMFSLRYIGPQRKKRKQFLPIHFVMLHSGTCLVLRFRYSRTNSRR